MTPVPRRLGILAGGGSLPREIAESAARRGQPIHIVAIDSEADDDFAGFSSTRVGWGQIGRMVNALKNARVEDLVIVGRVRRPDLFRLRPDAGFFRNLPALWRIFKSGGDDSVLRRVVRFFEEQGFRVVGPPDVAPELLVGEGSLGRAAPSSEDHRDIALGLDVVRALGPFDIGQSVVVRGECLEAVEGAEGTDGMLRRVAAHRRAGPRGESGGVLVKRPKPGQELRVDLPAIGPDTITGTVGAGLRGIAVEAGFVLAARRAEIVARADAAGIFVAGVQAKGGAADRRPPGVAVKREGAAAGAGRRKPSARDLADADKGRRVLEAMAAFRSGRLAVVTRGYVLAVESGEGIEAALERVRGLRQWGETRRVGVAVFSHTDDMTPERVAAVAATGLAGMAIGGRPGERPVPDAIIRAATEAGIFLLAGTQDA